jgi:hypothetical protein
MLKANPCFQNHLKILKSMFSKWQQITLFKEPSKKHSSAGTQVTATKVEGKCESGERALKHVSLWS